MRIADYATWILAAAVIVQCATLLQWHKRIRDLVDRVAELEACQDTNVRLFRAMDERHRSERDARRING